MDQVGGQTIVRGGHREAHDQEECCAVKKKAKIFVCLCFQFGEIFWEDSGILQIPGGTLVER